MSSLAEQAAFVPDDAGFFPVFTRSNTGDSDLRAGRSPIPDIRQAILLTRTTNFVNTIGSYEDKLSHV